MSLLYVLLICGLVGVAVGQQQCQTCMNNGIYCVDSTNYYVCADGQNPDTSMQLSCPTDQVCTNHADVCVLRTELTTKPATSVCDASGANGACGTCAANAPVVCVSRTQYAQCPDRTRISSCPTGEVCRIDTYGTRRVFCVPQCVMDFYGFSAACASTTPITTTTVAPPTTTPTTDARLRQICNDNRPTTTPTPTFFYVPNCTDLTCTRYIYCEQNGTSYDAVALACRTGFYDRSTNACVTTRPNNCVTSCA